jgi:radical SAM protein with 4Fe4S-binding SPASM domain
MADRTARMRELSASLSIAERLERDAFERCIPLNVTLELTLACNLRCAHCYNFDRSKPQPKARSAAELTPAEVRRVIGEVRDEGCLYLSLTGGEVLLHPHLLDFIDHARGLDLVVRLKSNATLLTTERARAVEAAGASEVDVSVYGGTAATHDAFTLQAGSFARTLAGARNAKDAGLAVRLQFCITRHNATETTAMIALAADLDVPYGFDPHLTARYDGTTSSLDHRVDRETLKSLYEGPLAHLVGTHACGAGADDSVQCACARSVCGISSGGDVYPCIGAPVPCGQLREQSFGTIWRESERLRAIRKLELADFATCAPCVDRGDCRRSSGVVLLNTGDYTGPEPFTCMEAQVLHELRLRKEP